MVEMDEKHIRSLMDCLLKPLGICLCYGKPESPFQRFWWCQDKEKFWFFKCIENDGVCKAAIDSMFTYVCLKHISDLYIAFKRDITEFAVPDGKHNICAFHAVENPYFKKTFEELLIMKDLMEDDGNGQ